ncbi:DUF3072 domain-containing protein [Nannocystis bainbridge]|uniref:DUF3072 domain-containing protein n=1 Tax=Nannocystis bainbridge TaxID=2995303 RepID=A0ABT5E374_9BACT|nr:DUF3072 domain-containing protein [Nannocystis bainbridge]MDC0720319.1 DUF3072 domain-containing protein [Nannocystis bainbridge]
MRNDNPKLAPREPDAPSNLEKDPDDWVTGDERMTDAQASYLKTLSEEAHEEFDPTLTKAEASKRIDALQHVTGRGRHDDAADAPARPPTRGRPEADDSPEDLDE